jgi:hypothetical protein
VSKFGEKLSWRVMEYRAELNKQTDYVYYRQWTLYLLSYYRFVLNSSLFQSGYKRHLLSADLMTRFETAKLLKFSDDILLKENSNYKDNNHEQLSKVKDKFSTIEDAEIDSEGYLILYLGNLIDPIHEWKKSILNLHNTTPDLRNDLASSKARLVKKGFVNEKIEYILVQQIYKDINNYDSFEFDLTMDQLINRFMQEKEKKYLLIAIEGFEKLNIDNKRLYLTKFLVEIIEQLLLDGIKFEKINFAVDDDEDLKMFESVLDELLATISYDSNFADRIKLMLTKYSSEQEEINPYISPHIETTTDPALNFRKKFSINCDKLNDQFRYLYSLINTNEQILLL